MGTGGDLTGFEETVRRLLPRIRRRALQLTGCPHTADDAVQDVWVRLYAHRQRLLRHPEPDAYAHATLHSVLCDGWRRHRRSTPVATTPEQPSRDCAFAVEARLEVERLLGTLTTSQAAAVQLIDLYGFTHDEAARLLGVHRGTVARTRRRALDRLRRDLDPARPPPKVLGHPRHTSASLRTYTARKSFCSTLGGMKRMKFSSGIRRAAVLGAAVAGLATMVGAPASAAQGDVARTSATQDAAAAAVVRTVGYTCFGSAVRRCVWLNVDFTNNRFRGYSRITDAAGGRNYSVATNYVRLQFWNGSRWVNLGLGNDNDGWHATSDTAAGGLVGCRNGGTYLVRSVAHFQWRGTPSGSSWVYGKQVGVRC